MRLDMALDPNTSERPRRSTFLHTLSAVLWSFFGVRKGKDHDADMAHLNPVHVILVGIGAAAALVIFLVILVNIIVAR